LNRKMGAYFRRIECDLPAREIAAAS
jgi:hypothetical protein